MNALYSSAAMTRHTCGSISGSGSNKKPDLLADGSGKAPITTAELRAKAESLLQRIDSCKKNNRYEPGLAGETSALLSEHSRALGSLSVKKNGAKTDGYMALLEARAELAGLNARSLASSGGC